MSAKLESVTIQVLPDNDGDASYLEQEGFEDRLAAYRNGDFAYVGVMLSAEIQIPNGESWIRHTIETPGLWSIESDSGEDYFRSVADDEAETLREMLAELHVSGVFSITDAPLSYR